MTGKAFADNPCPFNFSIATNNQCLTEAGSTIVLTIGPTGGVSYSYHWEYYNRDSLKWIPITGTNNVPQLTLFPWSFTATERTFRVTLQTGGHIYSSNSQIMCHCGVVALKDLNLKAQLSADQKSVVVTFDIDMSKYQFPELHASLNGRFWNVIAPIRGQSYIDRALSSRTKFYRIKVTTSNGATEYSEIARATIPNPAQPITVIIFTFDAKKVKAALMPYCTIDQAMMVQQKELPSGAYVIKTFQNGNCLQVRPFIKL